jgi:hypothetical protein
VVILTSPSSPSLSSENIPRECTLNQQSINIEMILCGLIVLYPNSYVFKMICIKHSPEFGFTYRSLTKNKKVLSELKKSLQQTKVRKTSYNLIRPLTKSIKRTKKSTTQSKYLKKFLTKYKLQYRRNYSRVSIFSEKELNEFGLFSLILLLGA